MYNSVCVYYMNNVETVMCINKNLLVSKTVNCVVKPEGQM